MNENDKILLEISQDVSFIKGVLTDYPKIVEKTNENETRSKKNQSEIKGIKETLKWLFRLVGGVSITWILTQVFSLVGR